MTDRPRGRRPKPADGALPWDTGPFEPLPKRTRARRQIDDSPPPEAPRLATPPGRTHSRRERERLRERHSERITTPAPVPPPDFHRATVPDPGTGKHRWWTRAAMFGLLIVLVGSAGAGRFLSAESTPDATVEPTRILAINLTPSATSTASVTPSATSTSTPSPTPTPDPRYIGKVVCLDAGHGGSDPGYTREENDAAPAMQEAYLNLVYARAVRSRLEMLGFTVVMTRNDDRDVNWDGEDVNGDGKTYDGLVKRDPEGAERAKDLDELQARINVCNEANADLLVSLHINGFPEASAKGYETWYSSARPFRERNRLIAQLAFQELGQEMDAAGYNARPRGINDDANAHVEVAGDAFDRYVITGPAQPGQIVPSAMPGAIVEVLFISNDEDAAFLASTEGRNAIVTAYADAIRRYFDEIAAE
jgi:N-acetylmuramoyl-L-alanine amidase